MMKNTFADYIKEPYFLDFDMLAKYLRMQGKKLHGGINLEMMKITDIIKRLSVILDAISFL